MEKELYKEHLNQVLYMADDHLKKIVKTVSAQKALKKGIEQSQINVCSFSYQLNFGRVYQHKRIGKESLIEPYSSKTSLRCILSIITS